MKQRIVILLSTLLLVLTIHAESRWCWQVVISEMMVDPSPAVALPEVEYLEVFNRSDSVIPLNGWTIRVGNKVGRLDADSLLPHAYTLLCSRTKVDSLRRYGKVVGVTAWPALSNDGCMPMLCDATNEPVTWASYQSEWIADKEKRQGGWSWECRDVDNLSGSRTNWEVSVATQGGTPGDVNSIAATLPDNLLPRVTHLTFPSDTMLTVAFNKVMHQGLLTAPTHYEIVNHTITSATTLAPNDGVALTLTPPLYDGEVLTIAIHGLQCQSGFTLNDTTLTLPVPSALMPQLLVVNEVMYQCAQQSEWLEVYNRSDESFDLSQCSVVVENNSGKRSVAQLLCNEARAILPHQYAVVSRRPESTLVPMPDDALPLTCALPPLPDEGGCIVLLSADSVVIDEVCYSPDWHHELLAEGHEVSLERIDADAESNDATNWQSAAASEGYATPGRKNSATRHEATDTKTCFTLPYETFTPNGDGYHDELQISYLLPTDGYVATITVFTPTGFPLHTIARQQLLATEGTLTWNGTTNGTPLPRGIYVIVVEAFHPSGVRIREKLTCVLS